MENSNQTLGAELAKVNEEKNVSRIILYKFITSRQELVIAQDETLGR